MPEKKPDWKSQAGLADILGVSRQAVQKLCGTGKKFEPAQNEKGKINRWHPVIVQHKEKLEADRKSTSGPIPPKIPKSQEKRDPPKIKSLSQGTEVSFEDIETLSIKEVVQNYGGISGFKTYVDAQVKMADWKLKEQKYRHIRNELIEKIPVASSLFSIIDMMLRRIVNEYPATVTDQLFAIVKSDKETSRVEAIDLQERTLSKIIKDGKRELVRSLKKID